MQLPYDLEESLEKVLENLIKDTGEEGGLENHWLRKALLEDISDVIMEHLDKLEIKND